MYQNVATCTAGYALEQPDTYLVSIRQLLAWMQVRLGLHLG